MLTKRQFKPFLFTSLFYFFLLPIAESKEKESTHCKPSYNLGPCYQGRNKLTQGLSLTKLNLSESDLVLSQWYHIKIDKFTMKNAEMRQARLRDIRLPFSRWKNVDMRGSTFSEVHLSNFSFEKINFKGAKISHSSFIGGDFREVPFDGAYITDSLFKDCILPKSLFEQAVLINVEIDNCQKY